MEAGRRRKRRKGPLLYDLTKIEDDYDLTKIEDDIRHCEWKRLEHMHLAAERSEFRERLLYCDGPSWHQRSAFDCNLSLNAIHEKWDKAIKLHLLVAVTYLSRYHPVFRQMDAESLQIQWL